MRVIGSNETQENLQKTQVSQKQNRYFQDVQCSRYIKTTGVAGKDGGL
jgi:hypothetical protein